MKIKKQYKQPDGTLIEVEGEEWEIENYEKKQEKKRQTEDRTKQRKLLLEKRKAEKAAAAAAEESKKKLDALTKPISEMSKEELLAFIAETLRKLQNQPASTVHHYYWHYDNGYWWRPWWHNGAWIYQVSQNDPYKITYTGGSTGLYGCATNAVGETSDFITCNSLDELTKSTGIDAKTVSSGLITSMLSSDQNLSWFNGNQINGCAELDTQTYGQSTAGVYTSLIGDGSQNLSAYKISSTAADATGGVTSGIVNLNMKS